MSKPKRGKNAKRIAGWRGVCPLCSRTGVRLLWEANNAESKKVKVCKICGSAS